MIFLNKRGEFDDNESVSVDALDSIDDDDMF